MKKLTTVLCAFLSVICFFSVGCKKTNPLHDKVSELRCNVFEGKSENFTISANYGFKETPYQNDAKVSQKIYILSFKLLDKESDGATYTLNLELDGEKFSSQFKFNPVSHSLTTAFEIENFTMTCFSVTVSSGALSETVTLSSIIPDKTIDYKTALDHLYNEQKELINVYTDDNGIFNAEIYARIVVKNQKPYWYVGIASGNDNLKALLVDGLTGEVLAIREIF